MSIPKETDTASTFPFEQTLIEIERLVEEMEAGKLTLEESLVTFEQGVKLTRKCQAALKEAEQRVELLLADADEDTPLDELSMDDTDIE